MIQTIKYENLPEELQRDLSRVYWTKILYIPLRELSYETGISINTLRILREKKTASYKTWQKLLNGLK